MRYAIVTDIHSNIEALTAVHDKIKQVGVDRILCLGDLVGYYCNPNEVVDWILKNDVVAIMGNHDVVACGKVEPLYFNPSAARAILWTRDELTEDNRKYIAELPDSQIIDDTLRMVHGSVHDRDEYLLFRPEIEHSFSIMAIEKEKPAIAFFGHTHRRIYYEFEDKNLYQGKEMALDIHRDTTTYLINPGSVGQPRDGDPRASFCVYDTEKEQVEFFRVNYDIDSTADKVRQLPFGEGLARRLYKGA